MASGVELATAYVSLSVSTRGMGQQINREFGAVERDADKAGKRIGGRLSSGIGGSLKGLAGIGAALGVADFLGDAISEARESQKVGAITTQIIKSTGGAAKITADQVGDLATAISNKTGVDDEAIQAGANMLLTFKNVKNEVGDGAKIFDRATQAAADLSAAGFGDMAGQSKMLGKALNDPIKGISALSRSGVTFTEQQKEQIKTLVKSGDVLGAQKIILKEVESQVGGTAEASATAGEKLATSFGNFKEGVGTALLPVLDTVFTKATGILSFLTQNIGPALKRVGDVVSPLFNTIKTGIEAFFAALEEGDVTSDGFVGFMETIGDFLHRVLPPAIEMARQAFSVIVAFIRDQVVPRFMSIVDAIKGFVAVAIPIVTGFVSGMLERIKPLMPTIRSIFGTIGEIITGALDLIKAVITRVTSVIAWIWSNWGTGIMNFIAEIWGKILNIIQPALEAIKGLIRTFTAIFKGDWSGAWNSLKGVFSSAWKAVRGVIDLALTLLGRALKIAWDGIISTAGAIWEKLTDAIGGPINRVLQFIQENFIDKINGLFAFLHIPIHLSPIWKQGNVGTGQANAGRKNPKNQKMYAEGGYTGPGSKYQPAGIVHAGEWVINQRSVKGIARDMPGLLPFLNGYASGGFVKPVNANPGFPYGRYPSGKIHRALDFPVPIGTPVRAPYSGSVLYAGWDSTGYGNVVRTHDSDGAYSILGHNSRLLVKTGQAINAGQVVAYSGSTGNSTGPHVHWARRTSPYNDATAFNPFGGGSGAAFNPIADLLKAGIETIASGARGFAGLVGGPFGPLFSGIVDRLIKGVGSRALSLLGIEGGELTPRLYDQGGMIQPGDTLVRNKTGSPETLLPFDIRDGGIFSDDFIDRFAERVGERVQVGSFRGISEAAAINRQQERQRVGAR